MSVSLEHLVEFITKHFSKNNEILEGTNNIICLDNKNNKFTILNIGEIDTILCIGPNIKKKLILVLMN